MRRFLIRSLGLATFLFATGCAGWTASTDDGKQGYEVYRPEPYLLIVRGTIADGTAQPSPFSSGSPDQSSKKDAGTDNKKGDTDDTASKEKKKNDALDLADKSPTTKDTDNAAKSDSPFTAKIIYLPNYSKPTRISTYNYLTKADLSMSFTDGWQFTGVSDKSDTSAVPDAAISAIGSIISSVVGTTKTAANTAAKMALLSTKGPSIDQESFALFKFQYDQSGNFIGLIKVWPK